MKNEYEIRGEVTAIFLNSPKYGNKETLISTNMLDRTKEFPNTWYAHYDPHTKQFYVFGNSVVVDGKRKSLKLHRWLTDAQKGMQVDHINHDTLDNTNGNLRIITLSENRQNLKGAFKNSKSGIRGVSWNQNKWRAVVNINGKPKHLGYFYDVNDAEQAVIEARLKYMPFSNEPI